MSRRCSICDHPSRAEIDAARIAGTQTYRDIARRHAVSKDAVARHVESGHVSAKLAKAAEAAEAASADSLLAKAQQLVQDAQAIQVEAMGAFDHRTALQAIREQARLLELLARLLGELHTGGGPTVNVHGPTVVQVSPELRAHRLQLAARAEARILEGAAEEASES